MKVQFDPITDSIIAFGSNLQGANIFDGPSDFNFDKYVYQSEVAGVFNLNGFTLKPPTPTPCPVCGQDYNFNEN